MSLVRFQATGRSCAEAAAMFDGWQDQHGDWYAICGNTDCTNVLSWHTSGLRKNNPDGHWHDDNTRLACRYGCTKHQPTKPQPASEREAHSGA